MTIRRFITGKLKENCYVVNDVSLDAAVIDPGDDAHTIIQGVHEANLNLRAILCTHGHFDHVGAVNPIQRAFRVPLYIHSDELLALREAVLYEALAGSLHSPELPEDIVYLNGLDRLLLGSLEVRVLPTPGHSPGGTTFGIENRLFTGDTLFKERPGRADLPGGSKAALQISLRALSSCPPETIIYPGHGDECLLGEALISRPVADALLEPCDTYPADRPSDSDPATQIVLDALVALNEVLPPAKRIPISVTASLFGSVGTLDSLGLVRLLVTIEQLAEERTGREIRFAADRQRWLSIRPFRNVATLAHYISVLIWGSGMPDGRKMPRE